MADAKHRGSLAQGGQVPSETCQEAFEGRVQWRVDPHRFAAGRVAKTQSPCMQQHPVAAEILLVKTIVVAAPVLAITDDRMVDMCQMLADLPKSAGFGLGQQ